MFPSKLGPVTGSVRVRATCGHLSWAHGRVPRAGPLRLTCVTGQQAMCSRTRFLRRWHFLPERVGGEGGECFLLTFGFLFPHI